MTSGVLKPAHSGVYATPAQLAALQAAGERGGLAWLTVDLAPVREKVRFLAECARGLEFPPTFGANWDALADCMQDLSWRPAPGYVLRLISAQEFASAAPRDFATAVEILEDAAMYWRARGRTFIVLVDGAPALAAFSMP